MGLCGFAFSLVVYYTYIVFYISLGILLLDSVCSRIALMIRGDKARCTYRIKSMGTNKTAAANALSNRFLSLILFVL